MMVKVPLVSSQTRLQTWFVTQVGRGLLTLGWLGFVLGLTACAVSFGPPRGNALAPATEQVVGATSTLDATRSTAEAIIAQALAATPGMTPTLLPVAAQATQAPPTVDPAAMQTIEAAQIATAVAATLAAQPTTTSTPLPTLPPTATPNPGATQTAAAQQIATSVAATLAAQPTATPIPTWTPAPSARIENFAACLQPCRGDRTNTQRTFPARTTKVYLTWLFSNFPIGAHYTRAWTLVGKGEWTRYECTWPGPTAGVENVALSAPAGIHAGTWEVTITVDQVVVLREQLVIEGNWDLWDPPGLFTTCYGTR